MMTFKKVTPEEAGLTNYCAYVANCQPLDFRKDGKEIRVYPAGTQDQESGYIQCGTPEYINGWLYGAVQTINGQVRPQNPEPAGILVSVALHDNESAPERSCTPRRTGFTLMLNVSRLTSPRFCMKPPVTIVWPSLSTTGPTSLRSADSSSRTQDTASSARGLGTC